METEKNHDASLDIRIEKAHFLIAGRPSGAMSNDERQQLHRCPRRKRQYHKIKFYQTISEYPSNMFEHEYTLQKVYNNYYGFH